MHYSSLVILLALVSLVSSRFWAPERKMVILDTDTGLHAADAAFVILADPTVRVVAMTTVHSCYYALNQTTYNLMRILSIAGRLDIPVYMGSKYKLSGDLSTTDDCFKNDGLMDSPDVQPILKKPGKSHAAIAIVTLVRRYPKEVSLVTTGSLTNVALAYLLEPNLFDLIKELIIIGGNYKGIGNITPYAEFNFFSDPDAASVVMSHVTAPTILVPWEFCIDHSISKTRVSEYLNKSSIKADFIKTISQKYWENSYENLIYTDGLAAVIWLHPEIVIDSFQATVYVERHNPTKQGQVYVTKNPVSNVKIVTKVVFDKLYDYMFGALYR